MIGHFSNTAKEVMGRAGWHAQKYEHFYRDTNHLLLALSEEEGNAVDSLFSMHQFTIEQIESGLLALSPVGSWGISMGRVPNTKNVEAALIGAERWRIWFQVRSVEPEHILLGVLQGRNKAVELLHHLGVSPIQFRDDLLESIGVHPPI